ncbi:MAG: hypothetical protein DHS20C20_33720 [Ardenticatenaceae bacterium]|nr:MAG: hypothetical protein DHS20C20_33720 [Ardenticatenaceae bacterium]
MRKYSATTTINAPAQTVWDILVNPAGYPEWDPGMVRVEGTLALGEKVKFFTKFSPDQAFAVKVTGFEPGKKMVFTGGMPLGLFKSERTHTLTAVEGGQVVFHTEETFSGLLLPIFGRTIPDLTESFEAFSAGLKHAAETA